MMNVQWRRCVVVPCTRVVCVCLCVTCAVGAEDLCGYCSHSASAQLHEAGYDAFITGLCFITMTSYHGQSVVSLASLAITVSLLFH